MEKLKCPDLRFGGFSENWEQSNFLDNIQSIVDYRGRTPKKLGMDWSKSGYLALSALNVKNGYIDPSIDAHYGDEKLYQKWMGGNELKKGQVLFTTEAPMGNVAQVPDDTGYILSQRTIAFNVEKKKISDTFLAVLLGSPNVFNRLSELCSGGTAKGVSQKSLSTLEVIFPKELNEQTQIGHFFKNLDQSIALHEKKLAQTQSLKKAMLEKMFPKVGSKQPEIRLKGFSGDWEQRKLGDIAQFSKGRGIAKQDILKRGATSCIRYGELYTTYGTIIEKAVSKTNVDKRDCVLSKANQVLIPASGETQIDIATASCILESGVIVGGDLNILTTVEDGIFLAIYLSSVKKYEIAQLAQGNSVVHLYATQLQNLSIDYPCLIEQKAIGQFFKQLDETLVLQQQQLQTLKNLKQAFLQKMFV